MFEASRCFPSSSCDPGAEDRYDEPISECDI